MNLPQWWKGAKSDQRRRLADESGYRFAYLKKQVSLSRKGSGQIPERMALRLCIASKTVTPDRVMTFEALCPELSEQYKQLLMGKGVAA